MCFIYSIGYWKNKYDVNEFLKENLLIFYVNLIECFFMVVKFMNIFNNFMVVWNLLFKIVNKILRKNVK